MKTFFFLGTAVLATTSASAQNTAVVKQHGSNHEITIVQEGTGNTSVVSQSNQASNRALISQSGASNTASINQGNLSESGTYTGQSVNVSQSGISETVINQTDGSNSINIYQRSAPSVSPLVEPTEKGRRSNSSKGRKRKSNK